jgi:hypothetical protein
MAATKGPFLLSKRGECMAVTGKDIDTGRGRSQAASLPKNVAPAAYALTALLAALAIYFLVGALIDWAQIKIDDIRYGRPRTMHLSGVVGHGEDATGQPSHFIAMNLDRQVIVLELPGGDASQVRSLPGPYLFGAGEDLTPVLITLQDVDNDGYNDLVIDVRSEQVIYLNRDGAFRLPTATEQQQLLQAQP